MPHNQSLVLHAPILIVDPDITHSSLLARMLEWAGYVNVTVSAKAPEALALFERLNPDLVLLDLAMRGDGAPLLLSQLRARADRIFLPVIAFTTNLTREARQLAVAQGASDIIVKFGDSDDLLMRIGNFLQIRYIHGRLREENLTLEETVTIRTAALELANRDLAERMAHAVEYRHDEAGDHASRVGSLSVRIGQILGIESGLLDVLRVAAGLHDVGNVAVPDLVLLKPGPLDAAEREIMQLHVSVGAELLARGHSPLLAMAKEIALSHHEHWNGKGYPRGFRKELIPLTGRIVAIADVYDALTHDRPYRKAKSNGEALAEIDALTGTQFDPTVARAFRQVLSEQRRAA